jgi:hypothetical protein
MTDNESVCLVKQTMNCSPQSWKGYGEPTRSRRILWRSPNLNLLESCKICDLYEYQCDGKSRASPNRAFPLGSIRELRDADVVSADNYKLS